MAGGDMEAGMARGVYHGRHGKAPALLLPLKGERERKHRAGGNMPALTLDQANRIIDAILQRGAELDCRPLSVIVVEPGCKPKAFQKEDGSSMIRFEMAFGKAYSALALGRSSTLVR